MKTYLPKPRQFTTTQKNQQKNVIFNIFVVCLLVMVLIGVVSPYLLKMINWSKDAYTNFLVNISPKKIEAINPIAPSLSSRINSLADRSVFDPKSYLDIDSYTLQVTDRSGLIVLFSKDGDLDQELSSLQSLLSKSRIESKRVKKVDLRFNKIAVEYDISR